MLLNISCQLMYRRALLIYIICTHVGISSQCLRNLSIKTKCLDYSKLVRGVAMMVYSSCVLTCGSAFDSLNKEVITWLLSQV